MPNQSDPNNQSPADSPQTAANPPIDNTPSAVMPDFQAADIPPMPADTPSIPTANVADQGPGSPPDLPPIISSTPKKKFGTGKIIATILGFLVLVGGIAGGVILTQQQQEIREKAGVEGPTIDQAPTGTTFDDPIYEGCLTEQRGSDGILYIADRTCGGGGGELRDALNCAEGYVADFSDTANSSIYCCKINPTQQSASKFGTKICRKKGNRIKNLGVRNCKGAGMIKQQVAPCKPINPAQCQEVKAYNTSWTQLTIGELSSLAPGASVNFCVTGSPDPASFDMAKFKINGVQKDQTTTKRPNSNDFCQSYKIESTDETVDVTAQIHHKTQGWK